MKLLTEFNEFWLGFNGWKVNLNGVAHQIRASKHQAIYPYIHTDISVFAEPINKNIKTYQEMKHRLGDDWMTDILESASVLQDDILHQLRNQQKELATP